MRRSLTSLHLLSHRRLCTIIEAETSASSRCSACSSAQGCAFSFSCCTSLAHCSSTGIFRFAETVALDSFDNVAKTRQLKVSVPHLVAQRAADFPSAPSSGPHHSLPHSPTTCCTLKSLLFRFPSLPRFFPLRAVISVHSQTAFPSLSTDSNRRRLAEGAATTRASEGLPRGEQAGEVSDHTAAEKHRRGIELG